MSVSPLTADHRRALSRPLSPSTYSIASSRREFEDEAHLLVSAVRNDSLGRTRKGVVFNFVAERLERGSRVRVKLKPNKHFQQGERFGDFCIRSGVVVAAHGKRSLEDAARYVEDLKKNDRHQADVY